MNQRLGILIKVDQPADGGESPNAYVPFITAELRVFWPPKATLEEITDVLTDLLFGALKEVARKKDEN